MDFQMSLKPVLFIGERNVLEKCEACIVHILAVALNEVKSAK
jgi:hypothetical protein